MSYIVFAVVGASLGALVASSMIPKFRLIPWLSTVVVLLSNIYFISFVLETDPNKSLLFVVSCLFGALMSSGFLWKDHPLLEGLGYFERVKFAAKNTRMLQETRSKKVLH